MLHTGWYLATGTGGLTEIAKLGPDFVHPLHIPSFPTAVSSIIVVAESASQIGVVDVPTHPSWVPEMSPQTLHAPVDRHFRLFGHLPVLVPSP